MALILSGMLIGQSQPEDIAGLFDAVFAFDDFHPDSIPLYHTPRKTSLTLAGSGKKGYKTVNISSLSAFVVACFDIDVMKLSAPSTSSRSGSEDFISLIGANRNIDIADAHKILTNIGVGFFDVQKVLPKFSSVYTGSFFSPHALIFAIAALAAPFATEKTIFGLTHPNNDLSLSLLQHYGRKHATVISTSIDSFHFIDEASSSGITSISSLQSKQTTDLKSITGLTQTQAMAAIEQGATMQDNIIKGLSGLAQPNTDLAKEIAINSAVIIKNTDDTTKNLDILYQECLNVIASGQPLRLMRSYIDQTRGQTSTLDHLIDCAHNYAVQKS